MPSTNVRRRVLAMLFLLSVVTYLDRVCISVAAPELSKELGLSPSQMGWVFAAFTAAYGIFEIPGGWMGDRFGPRLVLTRIVVWWSVFTAATGAVFSYGQLLAVRALFGAGEAGAYPNSSCTISRWFPTEERGQAHGFVWMASRLGGALSPILVVPLQAWLGWRAAFFVFSLLGVVWAVAWWKWFRDFPGEKSTVNQAELEIIGPAPKADHSTSFWTVASSGNLWAVMLMYHCFCYGSYWYISWLPTYLTEEKGLEAGVLAAYSALPWILAAAANLAGGYSSDFMVKRIGLRWGRRLVGMGAVSLAGSLMLVSLRIEDTITAVIVLGCGFAASDFMLPNCWAVCLDIGREKAGVVTGAMNTAGQVGATIASAAYGGLVETYGWNLPLKAVAAMFFLSALAWLIVDPTKRIGGGTGDSVRRPEAILEG